MTIYNATTKRCTVVDAREVAPLVATELMYKGKWNESQIGESSHSASILLAYSLGWKAVAVPGELHGLWTEYQRFGSGRVAWKSLIQPTIDLLEEGFPTSHALAKALSQKESWILNEPTMQEFVNPKTKKVYRVGEQIRTRWASSSSHFQGLYPFRTSFLNTLRLLANSADPVETFYNSNMTKDMAEEFKQNGGLLTVEDFQRYRTIVKEDGDVIYSSLRGGRQVCGAPPPAGSAVALAILGIMDG